MYESYATFDISSNIILYLGGVDLPGPTERSRKVCSAVTGYRALSANRFGHTEVSKRLLPCEWYI